VGKTLTDLQILGCELHQNAFGGQAPSGPAGRSYSTPQASQPLLGEGTKGKKRVGNREGLGKE